MKIKGIITKALAYGLICILILLNSGLVYGQETLRAAVLSDFTGEVSIMKAGGEKPIKAFKGMSVAQGDRIITGRNASATLDINKDIILHVAENTQMLISELIESSKADSKTTSLNLQTGGIWTSIKKALNINSKFEVKTPTAVMGARGTEFYTSYNGNTTDVSVLSGAVSISSYKSVANEDGTTEQITLEVILKNNQYITLEARPDELIDFIVEELTLEKMDLFAVEIIKNILETEPELVKPELIEKIDQVIEKKKEEKKQQQEKEQEKKPEFRIEYDSTLEEDSSGSNGGGDKDKNEDKEPSPIFTVSFDVDGGSAVASQTVSYNGKASQPADSSKPGYTFGGWYTDNTFTTVFDFANTNITANTTIYAKWIQGVVYWISEAEDLFNIMENMGGYYRLEKDIDMTVYGAVYEEGQGWLPIGTVENPFTGCFDGNGKTISGLFINRPEMENVGLFGYSEGATFADVHLDGVNVTGGFSVGSLIGCAIDSGISNSSADGSVTGLSSAGGLVGYNYGSTISGSHAAAAVTSEGDDESGGDNIGGLAGYNDSGTIANSYATGAVTGYFAVGGLVGGNWSGTITDSHATGAVSSIRGDAGGLVGTNYGIISGSYAMGTVEGEDRIGGLVGINWEDGTIEETYAAGSVTGSYSLGGLVGVNLGNIYESYAMGNVKANLLLNYHGVGGLAGVHQGEISNAYATGDVEGIDNVGGLVGLIQSGTVENTYATGGVTGTGDNVGGLVGSSDSGTINDSYYDSDTTHRSDEDNEWGAPKPTIDMMKQETFNPEPGTGWDFENIWTIEEGTYPHFRW